MVLGWKEREGKRKQDANETQTEREEGRKELKRWTEDKMERRRRY